MSTPWRIIDVPAPPDGVDESWQWWWVYEAYSGLRRAEELAVWGYTDRWAPTPVLVSLLRDSAWRRTLLRAAVRERGRAAGDVLGVAEVGLPVGEAVAYVNVLVAQEVRGEGIGSALADAAERLLDAEGRTTRTAWVAQAPEPDPGDGVVTAPTGAGRVDVNGPAVRFATGRGYRLEQVERVSQLDLPPRGVDVEGLLADAATVAGPDYAVHTWTRTVPPEYHEQLARLWERMSTDVPAGELDVPPEAWDAARVAAHLERQAQARQQIFLAAAEHVPTGRLVAFTEVDVPDFDAADFGFQGDTLVMREHRGRRLGMLVKAANLLQVQGQVPRVRRLHTMNAEENRYMLAINETLGYRGTGVIAAMQKRVG